MADQAAADPIGLAQVGIGYWGRNLLRNFAALPGARMIMACDQDPGVRSRVAGEYPQIRITGRFEDLLESADVSGVIIATETPTHFEMASAALRAGKHVFIEKPMAQTGPQAEELVRLAEEGGRHLMVGHLLLYHPAFEYVDSLIRSGTLGDVYYLYSVRVNLGIVRQRENAFESLAPHDLSVALQLLDRKPVAVSAQGHAYLQPGVEDVVFATVYFQDGRLAHLHSSWLDPHKVRRVTVVGSKQMAVIDDVEATEKVRLYDKGVDIREAGYADYEHAMTVRTGDITIPKIEMKEPLRIECEHFVDCIRENRRPRSDGRNGLEVVRIMDAAKRSMTQRGAAVEI